MIFKLIKFWSYFLVYYDNFYSREAKFEDATDLFSALGDELSSSYRGDKFLECVNYLFKDNLAEEEGGSGLL